LDRFWTVRRRAPESHFALFAELPRPVAQLLWNRGLKDRDQVEAFFTRQVSNQNPFQLRGMKAAVERIRQAIAQGESIIVHGDFDADGVTSTAVMVKGLYALGAEVSPYIPHRVDEGYGLNADAIHKMKADGVSLMVTVDCGIRAHKEIILANELGIDVVVTDHHSPRDLPPALVVINPHQDGCEYPAKCLAGVGIAWKTVQALWLAEQRSPLGKQREKVNLRELLALVALGTVADVMPLTDENRKLVWDGLDELRRTRRPGLLALMEIARITPASVDEEAIGFALAPRINAAGRLDSAMLAYDLLQTQELDEAHRLAGKLEAKNRERQSSTQQAVDRALSQLTDPYAPLLLVTDEHCPEGIVGLVAGRLLEQFYRPAIVVAQGSEWSRASCRSIPEVHITSALDRVAHLLERHGGHAAAAGFTIRTEHLPAFEAALSKVVGETLNGKTASLRPKTQADAELSLEEISDGLVDLVSELAPFGAENQQPIWMCRDVMVRDARPVGDGGKHLKLTLVDESRRQWSAIAFRQGSRRDGLPQRLDIAFTVKRSEWQGRNRLELHLVDFRPALERVPA
jgi:single-stranded-DNA-specific exonuclease